LIKQGYRQIRKAYECNAQQDSIEGICLILVFAFYNILTSLIATLSKAIMEDDNAEIKCRQATERMNFMNFMLLYRDAKINTSWKFSSKRAIYKENFKTNKMFSRKTLFTKKFSPIFKYKVLINCTYAPWKTCFQIVSKPS